MPDEITAMQFRAPEQVEALVLEGYELIQEAKNFKCTNDAELEACMVFFKKVKEKQKQDNALLDRDLEPMIRLLHKMHSDAVGLRKQVQDPTKKSEEIIEGTMRPYRLELKRKEDAEKARLEKEAKDKAEQDRQLLLLEAQLDGETEQAAVIEQLPAPTPKVEVKSTAPKVEGVGTRYPWKWKIVDAWRLPREALMPDPKAITKMVNERRRKDAVSGVEAWEDVTFTG